LSLYVAQAGLELEILLPQPPEWGEVTGVYHYTQLPLKSFCEGQAHWFMPVIPAMWGMQMRVLQFEATPQKKIKNS
jgi:hypothetical protein